MRRGEIHWADLTEPSGSGPGFRRPAVVVSANSFNDSRIATAIVAIVTSNLALAQAPGNVLLPARESGLSRDSVVNVSQLFTVDKSQLSEKVGLLNARRLEQLDAGLRLVLSV